MMIPDLMGDVLPATDVKRRFLEILKRLGVDLSVVTITRNGVPAGILMSVEEYESLLETLEILADQKTMRSLERSRRQIDRGRTLRHDEVWRQA